MCGRLSLISTVNQLEKRFKSKLIKGLNISENVNISAGEKLPVITQEQPEYIQEFTFGFTPYWAHKPTYVINARSEGSDYSIQQDANPTRLGIFKKPMFKHAIIRQRCLVLIDGFIEGSKQDKLNAPYLIYPNTNPGPIALAGIYDTWNNPLTGIKHQSVAIVTTTANSLLRRIGHHRSPIILDQKDEKKWIDNTLKQEEITGLLKTFDSSKFNAYPITNQIKNPSANNLELIKPIGNKVFKDYSRDPYSKLKYYKNQNHIIQHERMVAGDQYSLF